jgi:hypothetical protein
MTKHEEKKSRRSSRKEDREERREDRNIIPISIGVGAGAFALYACVEAFRNKEKIDENTEEIAAVKSVAQDADTKANANTNATAANATSISENTTAINGLKGVGASCNMFSTYPIRAHPLYAETAGTNAQGKAVGPEFEFAFPTKTQVLGTNGKMINPEYLPYDQKDSNDFSFENDSNGLPTKIVCKNAGKWEIVNQYQLDCLRSTGTPEAISGFAAINGDAPIANSSATCTVTNVGDKVVLVIAYTVDLKVGDYFQVGVASSDVEVAIINSYPGPTGLVDPICITLCNKLQNLEE